MSQLAERQKVFQATDLARHSRAVLDEGHSQPGALIRDTDGTALLLAPAHKVHLDQYTRAGFRDAAHLLIQLVSSGADLSDPAADTGDVAGLGNLAWLSVLSAEDRLQFVVEYVRALDQADGLGGERVEQLLYEWQQTARAWMDEDVRAGLLGDVAEPLLDVEL